MCHHHTRVMWLCDEVIDTQADLISAKTYDSNVRSESRRISELLSAWKEYLMRQ